jgi:hypothetical protein
MNKTYYVNYSVLPYRCRKWRHRLKAKFYFDESDLRSQVILAVLKAEKIQPLDDIVANMLLQATYPKFRGLKVHAVRTRIGDLREE